MPSTVAERVNGHGSVWPLTRDAREALVEQIANLRAELAALTGEGMEEGVHRLPITISMRRLTTLKDVLDRCEVVDHACAAIGRRATLRDGDGRDSVYEIVFPGDGDPDRGRISADSPLGRAILGARPGDRVHVSAPAGEWAVTVVAVE